MTFYTTLDNLFTLTYYYNYNIVILSPTSLVILVYDFNNPLSTHFPLVYVHPTFTFYTDQYLIVVIFSTSSSTSDYNFYQLQYQ